MAQLPILLVDNYDSFTYNVVHLLREVGAARVEVLRNTAVDPARIADYAAVIASPGPGLPKDSGRLLDTVRACIDNGTPYLGICLGHQALGEALGGKLHNLGQVKHGVQETITATQEHALLRGLPSRFDVGRYHSWAVVADGLPGALQPIAHAEDGCIMAMAVVDQPIYGVQFHPESIMSPRAGHRILANFLSLAHA